MSQQNKLGPTEIIPPLVAVAGTIIWISLDGFTGESIAQSLTALCTMFVILIPLYKHILQKPRDTHLETGIKACISVQKAHRDILTGPKFRKDDYEPGSTNTDQKFLFIQKPGSRQKATFIAISPLKKAILEISFSITTMQILNIKGNFEKHNKELHDKLVEFAEQHFQGLFIEKNTEEVDNICVVLDFDIEQVSVNEFRSICRRLIERATIELIKMK